MRFKLTHSNLGTFPNNIASIEIMLLNWLGLLMVLLGPVVMFAVIIHFLQWTTQKRLVERFGWRSVLWTGWLGTPIHELSHVIMCLVFRHRIDAVSLFEPDRDTGRLGYVRHSWRVGNWYEELGNVFIGIAPLIGGSAALLMLLWIFYPATLSSTNAGSISTANVALDNSSLPEIFAAVSSVCAHLLQWRNLTTIKFWVFIYLVLCVGSHMAPSWSDYRGTGRAAILFFGLLMVTLLIASLFIADSAGVQVAMLSLLSPLFALFAITILLCLIAAIITRLVLGCFPKRFDVR